MSSAPAVTSEGPASRVPLELVQPEAHASVEAVRAASRDALRRLVEILGQPAEWGDELEEAAFRRGSVWRVSRPPAA